MPRYTNRAKAAASNRYLRLRPLPAAIDRLPFTGLLRYFGVPPVVPGCASTKGHTAQGHFWRAENHWHVVDMVGRARDEYRRRVKSFAALRLGREDAEARHCIAAWARLAKLAKSKGCIA